MGRQPASLSGLTFVNNATQNPYVSLGSQTPINNLTALTLEMFISPVVNPSYAARIASNHDQVSTGFELYFSGVSGGGQITGYVGNGSTRTAASMGNAVNLNVMNHVALCWDGNNVRVFVNGVASTAQALAGGNTGIPSGHPFLIGNYQTATSRPFPGTISEVRISNIARYSGNFIPPSGPFIPDANTVGLYHFNEGSGTVAHDSSASQNNGTLSGSPLPIWSPGKWVIGPTSRTPVASTPRISVQNFNCSLLLLGSTYVTTPFVPAISTGFNAAGWFYWHGGGNEFGARRILSYVDNGGGFELNHNSPGRGLLNFVAYNGATPTTLNTGVLQPGWHHYAITYQSSNVVVYIDGQVSTSSGSAPMTAPTSQLLTLGAISGTHNQQYLGKFNNFVFYNGNPWTLQQVQALYTQGILPQVSAFFPMQEGSQSVAYDVVGGQNGTIVSSVGYSADVPGQTRKIINNNLVYNGNFEFAPIVNVNHTIGSAWVDGTSGGSTTNNLFGWADFTGGSNSPGKFDNSTAHSGSYSFKISTLVTNLTTQFFSSPTTANWINPSNPSTILLQPNTSYILTYWMKTQTNSGSAATGAQLIFSERNAAGGQTQATAGQGVTTTTGWTQYQLRFTTLSTTAFGLIKLAITGNDGSATLVMDAWFDSIVLTPATVPQRTAIVG